MAPMSCRTAAAIALSLLGSQATAHVDGVCRSPSGGSVDSPCMNDGKHCIKWTNATCVDGDHCECRPDQCNILGQCVDKGQCNTDSGGLCALLKCDAWRNATCSENTAIAADAKCLCGPGTCPIKGECRPPGVCAKATGGSCAVMPCHAWRNATCSVSGMPGLVEQAKCMCGEGTCPINGECRPPGGCSRFTGDSCMLFDCKVGQCSADRYCMCEPHLCFVGGKCVAPDTVRLSLDQGREQEDATRQDLVVGALAALVGAAATAMSVSIALAGRARGSTHADDYEQMVEEG